MKYAIITIKILISAALLTYLVNKAHRNDQFEFLFSSSKQWSWLLVAFLLVVLAHLINFVRWWTLARDLSLNMRLTDAMKIGFVTQFFGLVAFGVVGSDTARAYYAMRHMPGKKAYAVASVFFDRLIGLLTMMGCAGIGYWLNDWQALRGAGDEKLVLGLQSMCWLLWWVAILGFVGLFAAVYLPKRLLLRVYEWSLKTKWIGGVLGRLVKVLIMFRERKLSILIAIFYSLLINFVFVLAIDSVGRFVGGNRPTLEQHVVIAPISMIANCVPLPGGLGGMEAVLDLQYQALTAKSEPTADDGVMVPKSVGVVVGFGFRATLLGIALIGALLWLSLSANERRSLRGESGR